MTTRPAPERAPLVTDEDVRSYVDDGYLVVPGVFSDAEVDLLRADAVEFARGHYPVANPVECGPDDDDATALGRLLAVHFPHWVSPVVAEAVTQDRLASVIQRITGAHLPHWDGSAKCMQTMLFVKPPGLPGQAWHQDERFITTRDRSLVGAWIALDDADDDNGCLRVLPGSHRPGVLWPTGPHDRPGEFDLADEAKGFDPAGEIVVEVAAGDVVFFNGYLLHRSMRNRSDRLRRALVNHYMTASSLLPWSIPSVTIDSGAVSTLDNRAVVPLGTDPYADRGYDAFPAAVYIRPHE